MWIDDAKLVSVIFVWVIAMALLWEYVKNGK